MIDLYRVKCIYWISGQSFKKISGFSAFFVVVVPLYLRCAQAESILYVSGSCAQVPQRKRIEKQQII